MIGLTGRLVGMAASSQLPDIQRDDRDDRVALRGSKRRRAHRRMCAQVRSHFHTTSIALGFPPNEREGSTPRFHGGAGKCGGVVARGAGAAAGSACGGIYSCRYAGSGRQHAGSVPKGLE
jgi:hypothetical protein